MNRTQEQQYIAAQKELLKRAAREHQWDYAITLHTNLRTYAVAKSTLELRIELTQRATQRFRQMLNRLLTGNGWRRKPAYTPHFLSSIEGIGDKDKTLHIHASIGNVGHRPTEATRQLLEEGIRQLWLKTNVYAPVTPNLSTSRTKPIAIDNVDVKLIVDDVSLDLSTEGWIGYTGKEAETKRNWSVVDWTNSQAI
jgi:hypothetical protein